MIENLRFWTLMKMVESWCYKKVFGLLVVMCFANIFVCMCAVHQYGHNRDGVNASCDYFCWNNSLGLNESLSIDLESVIPNCTEHCTYAAYTCPDGYISIQTPHPQCVPFVACNDTSLCNLSNCTTGFSEHNSSCLCSNGSETTVCNANVSCPAQQCDHGCIDTTNGTECSCLPGFILEDDNSSCVFDNSSTFIRCDANCSHGICMNETCHCFFGYSLDGNGSCTIWNSSYECVSKSPICETRNSSLRGNRTRECKNGSLNINGTCHGKDPCGFPGVRNSCERQGKRCRPKDDGDFECYCGLPHYPIYGPSENQNYCVFPAASVFIYRLSLVLLGWYDNSDYALLRQMEEDFGEDFFSNIVNCTLLNLEAISFSIDPIAPTARLSLYVLFAEELPYFGELLFAICSTYPNMVYEDACILPGNIIVRRSKINYTEIDNVCDMDDSISDFLCGPLAKCSAGENANKYKCKCNDGYKVERYVSPLKPNCVDVDECVDRPCKHPNQICRNNLGNYSCDCIPCYIWNQTRNMCVSLCEANPCEHNGICILNELETGCGFHCSCKDEFKGLTCSETNNAIKNAKTNIAITGGILGAILGLTIIVGVLLIYTILKRTGYFSFRSSKISLR